MGRPRRVQRRNRCGYSSEYAAFFGSRGNSARSFAGGDVPSERPYLGLRKSLEINKTNVRFMESI